jgi:hypothetical protein
MEGMKSEVVVASSWKDDDPCPFHQEYGVEGKSFKKCCKETHLKRVAKEERTNAPHTAYYYNPFQEEEARHLRQAFVNGTVDMSRTLMRISPLDIQVIRIRVPMWVVSVVKERLDDSCLFHAIFENKWYYIGHMPQTWSTCGSKWM